jgi:hypothetical protein
LAVYRQNPRCAGRIVNGLAFVVTPDDHKLHTLNATASEIWKRAASGCTPEDAAAAIVDGFDVDLETALADVHACCRDLVERRILTGE